MENEIITYIAEDYDLQTIDALYAIFQSSLEESRESGEVGVEHLFNKAISAVIASPEFGSIQKEYDEKSSDIPNILRQRAQTDGLLQLPPEICDVLLETKNHTNIIIQQSPQFGFFAQHYKNRRKGELDRKKLCANDRDE